MSLIDQGIFEFEDSIREFNKMYKLPINTVPTSVIGENPLVRLINFRKILEKELTEMDDVLAKYSEGDPEFLTHLADLLGDIQVYCASEMCKFGIPLDDTLNIIMQSNMSKLGLDGKPICDEQGKVMKGPGYWKPEPKLFEMINSLRSQAS